MCCSGTGSADTSSQKLKNVSPFLLWRRENIAGVSFPPEEEKQVDVTRACNEPGCDKNVCTEHGDGRGRFYDSNENEIVYERKHCTVEMTEAMAAGMSLSLDLPGQSEWLQRAINFPSSMCVCTCGTRNMVCPQGKSNVAFVAISALTRR